MRGAVLCIAMFVLGGAVLWGLFLSPRAVSPPPPAGPGGPVWGAPDRPLRVVSFNILHNQRGAAQVEDTIRRLSPDVVFLQEVESRDVVPMAAALGMQQHYHPRAYHASENLAGRRASWGNLILSKHPLYSAGSIPNPGGGSFGVWAVTVIDNRKFLLANVHLSATWKMNPAHIREQGNHRHKELTNLVTAWRDLGAPPMIVGGDFNQIPFGNNYAVMTEHFTDALDVLGRNDTTFRSGILRTRIDYFLLTPQWRPIDGTVVESDASDHKPIWVDVQAAPAPAATTPARAKTSRGGPP